MLSLTKVLSCLTLVAALVAVTTCANRRRNCAVKSYLIMPQQSQLDWVLDSKLYPKARFHFSHGLKELLARGLRSYEIEHFLSSSSRINRCRSRPKVLSYTKHKFGYRATMNTIAAEAVKRLPSVKFVEEETMFNPTPDWHLDRIDQTNLPLDGSSYDPIHNGAGVDIYIIDSGIRYTHQEFDGRARYGGFDPYDGDGWDRMGHGTHVAALAAGNTVGSAPKATLYSVRVFDEAGAPTSTIVTAIIDVIIRVLSTPLRRAVINMSLGGSYSAIQNQFTLIADYFGIVTVVSAGNNDFADACTKSPASSPHAITVAASDRYDNPASFTNIGSCVDIFAPGANIRSASHTSSTGYTVKSGTSMAAPLVAGAAAMVLTVNPSATPSLVRATLVGWSSIGVFNSVPFETPNRLLRVP